MMQRAGQAEQVRLLGVQGKAGLDIARSGGLVGGLVTWSWHGALTALFWAGLVRIALLHHVTWSVKSRSAT